MRALLIVVVLLIVGIVGVGFYRGWFQISSNRDSEDQKVNTTFTVDEERIGEDKEKLQGFADQAKDEPVETSEETK
jgi:cytoskeletal protein RodZ